MGSYHFDSFELPFGTAAVCWGSAFAVLAVWIGAVGEEERGGVCMTWKTKKGVVEIFTKFSMLDLGGAL